MHFHEGRLYWVFNEGNNRQDLFRDEEDYLVFLLALQQQILGCCEPLAWCLVPGSFSILLRATRESEVKVKLGGLIITKLADGLRRATSGYGRYYNRRYQRRGSVIRPKTRAAEIPRMMDGGEEGFYREVFQFINDQPRRMGLVVNSGQWPHSSFAFFAGLRMDDFCNKELAGKLLGYDQAGFIASMSCRLRPEFLEFVERSGW